MNEEVKQAIEFLRWLLEGLVKFYPDHPLFSRAEAEQIAKGENKWVGWTARGILNLARRSLDLSSSAALNDVISSLQNLVNNPSAVSSLPEPILATLREEEQELLSGDSPAEKSAKLERLSRRPARARLEKRAPEIAARPAKVPTPPTTKAPVEVTGFPDIKAPADIATLKGATEAAFIDEVVQTIRRENPDIDKVASLEQMRKTAEILVRQMEAGAKGGENFKINTTAFSRAISDPARIAEVLVSVPAAAEIPQPPPLQKPPAVQKEVYLAPESPLPELSPEVQTIVSDLVAQVKADEDTFVRDLGREIEKVHPDFSGEEVQETAKRIATRIKDYEPGKASNDAVIASVALSPQVFERVFPTPEVRGKILDEVVNASKIRQEDERIAAQVIPTIIPGSQGAVNAVYEPTRQTFRPTAPETPGPIVFNPRSVIERVERAPQGRIDLSGAVMHSGATPQPFVPTTPQGTLRFLSVSSGIPEDIYKADLAKYLEAQIRALPPDDLGGLNENQLKKGVENAAGLIIEKTPPEIRSGSTPVPITVKVPELIESFQKTPDAQGEAISGSFEIATEAPQGGAVIQVSLLPSAKPLKEQEQDLAARIEEEIKSLPPEARVDPQTKKEIAPEEIQRVSSVLAEQTIDRSGVVVGATAAPTLIEIRTPDVIRAAMGPEENLQTEVTEAFNLIKTPTPSLAAPPPAVTQPSAPAIKVSFSRDGKPPELMKEEVAAKIRPQLENPPPQVGVRLTQEQIDNLVPVIAEEAVRRVEPGTHEPTVVRIEAPALARVATLSAQEVATEAPEIVLVAPAAVEEIFEKAPRAQVFIGASEKMSPQVLPEVRTQVEDLAKTTASDPENFQSQLREKLITSPQFAEGFSSPEEIAQAADVYSKDVTERLVAIDKGVAAPPSLAEVAASTQALDITFASPEERQVFVASATEKAARINESAPAIASVLGTDEEVINAAYLPRPLTVSDSPEEGFSVVTTKNLLPAAQGEIPVSEAIIPSVVAVPSGGKLPWAKKEGPAQDLGIKINYLSKPEQPPRELSDLVSHIENAGPGFSRQNPQEALPLFMFASGVSSGQFQELIAQSQEKGFSPETKANLEGFLLRLKTIEETNEKLFAELQRIYPQGSIEISFVEYSEAPGVFALRPSDGTYQLGSENFAGDMRFNLSPISNRISSFATKKLNKLIAPAKKKIAEKLAATGAGKAVKAVGSKLIKGGISKLIGGLLTKLGLSALASAIAPGIGTVVALIASFAKDLISAGLRFFKKHAKDIALALIAGGLALTAVGQTLAGGLMIGGGVGIGAGAGFGSIGGTIGAFFNATWTAITNVVFPAIAAPLIFALLFTPLVIALILFIINSGAYVVPPRAGLGFGDNPYIAIEKEASLSSGPIEEPLENSDLPTTVTYTITITARRGSLTNISFNYECRVIGPNVECPSPSPEIPEPPGIISPVEPYVITYTATYDSRFEDSLVVDTFTITADSPEVAGTTAAASATVVIGNPPIDCPLASYETYGKAWASYTPGDESRGHGSNWYWAQVGGSCRSYPIPQSSGCFGPSSPSASSNMCYRQSSTCAQYGFAYDVFPGSTEVLAPQVGGQPQTWSCSYRFANGSGTAGYTYWCTSGQYRLVLTHVAETLSNGSRSGTFSSGEQITELYPMSNTHLHMEFSINGVYQRPEDFFCF